MRLIHIAVTALAYLSAYALDAIPVAAQTYGVVGLSANYMRIKPDYESALETQALMGTPVEILDTSGYWLKIRTSRPDYTAWATDMGITAMSGSELKAYIAADKYICTVLFAEMYDAPSKKGLRVGDLVAGDLLRISDGHKNGFLAARLPSGERVYVLKGNVSPFREWADSRRATRENLVKTAFRFLGTPYLWGGTSSKGLDCSGLVWNTYFLNGIVLPRNASQQVHVGIEVSLDGFVPEDSEGDLLPGDLLFFGKAATDSTSERITHVGIYTGNGHLIHSSHLVRCNSMRLGSADYYTGTPRLLHARRIVDSTGRPYDKSLYLLSNPSYFPNK